MVQSCGRGDVLSAVVDVVRCDLPVLAGVGLAGDVEGGAGAVEAVAAGGQGEREGPQVEELTLPAGGAVERGSEADLSPVGVEMLDLHAGPVLAFGVALRGVAGGQDEGEASAVAAASVGDGDR